jgi:hypothetical protein
MRSELERLFPFLQGGRGFHGPSEGNEQPR